MLSVCVCVCVCVRACARACAHVISNLCKSVLNIIPLDYNLMPYFQYYVVKNNIMAHVKSCALVPILSCLEICMVTDMGKICNFVMVILL